MLLLLAAACSEYGIKEEPQPGIPDIQVHLGPVPLKACPDTVVQVEVANRGDATLAVDGLTLEGDGWTVDDPAPFQLEPDERVDRAVRGAGGTATLRITSNDTDQPLVEVPIASAPNEAPTALVLTPYDEDTLPADGTVTLTALVSDADDALADLTLEWASSLSGSFATATPDADGFVTTEWAAEDRAPGPQWISLFATDPCAAVAEDIAWICQDGPFVVYPIIDEGWHFEGSAGRDGALLTVSDGTPDLASAAFDLASIFDADDTEVSFAFRIDGTGGEGLSLTLLDADRRVGYLGGGGCGMGFGAGAACTSGPALPGWSLAVDTRDDAGDCVPGPHLAFHFDGDLAAPAACAPIPSVEDGAWHTLHVRLVDQHLTTELDGIPALDAALTGYTGFQGVVGVTVATSAEPVRYEVQDFSITDFHCAW